jgi:hypothetical protein
VSYLYYAKFVQPRDSTYFRHLDHNLRRLTIEDRGGFQIQGSLLLDDKYPGSCTEVVLGMHKPENLKFWYKQVVNRA